MAVSNCKNRFGVMRTNQDISKNVIGNLNMIRAMSGLVVVFSHFFQLYIMPVAGRTRSIDIAIASSEYAVLTFFTLSGFLIALSIQRNIENNGYFVWSEYLISRAARIYPALIASVLLCLFLYSVLNIIGLGEVGSLSHVTDVYPVTRTEFSVNLSDIFFTLLQSYAFGPGNYILANGPLWSLSYEVGFYLVAGLLVTLLRGRSIARIISAACLVLVTLVAIKYGKYLFLHYGTIWLLGVSLFYVLNVLSLCPHETFSRWNGMMRIIGLFLVLTLTNAVLALSGLVGAFIHNYLSSILIVIVLFFSTRFRFGVFNYFSNMADSTYTLYLFHFPLMLFFYALIRDSHNISPVLYFSVTSVFTLALIPTCHFIAGLLENRRFWETLLNRLRIKPNDPILPRR